MKTTRRGLMAKAAGLTATGLAAAGCSEWRVNGFDALNLTLDIANNGEPLSLDPHKVSGTWENNLVGSMFIGLTTEDEHADPIPGMAERWEVSDDGLVWTFFLRDAVWSDGVPVTAHDFVAAYRRILNPETKAQYASILYPIKNSELLNNSQDDVVDMSSLGVRAIDDKIFEMTLEHPAPYLPSMLKHYTSYPIPRHVLERMGPDGQTPIGDDWVKPANIVVNGPYKLKSWQSNYIVVMDKNDLFYDAQNVQLRRLYFYPTTDANVQARGVISGERGWATNFPSNKVETLRAQLPGYVRTTAYLLVQYLSFNTTRAPFNDVRVRRALSMAINREFIATQIYKTSEQPAYSNVPPGVLLYPGEPHFTWRDQPIEQRQAEARRLLEEAGYGPSNPLQFEFSHRNSGDNPRVAVVVQADWRAIAPWVTVQLAGTEVQVHYATLRAKDFAVGDGGWVADYNDAKSFLFLHETRTGPQNYSGYSNPAYDALMVQASRESVAQRRADILQQAEQLMLDDAPIAPIVFGSSRNLITPMLEGFQENLEDIHRIRYFRTARQT
jgi:oligopeptide transport system substrate-binding protein